MSDDTEAREEAEARLAEAKAQLAAAEEAYRQVVPCEHRTMTISNGEEFSCADCGAELPDPRGCQHRRIDNASGQCVACGERMASRERKTITVLSAPNAAACTNPECSGDINDPNCDNPHGVYVPDLSQQREVPIRWDFTYQCDRCRNDGTVFTPEGISWDCGHDHRGDSIPIRDEVSA
ncbi:hypothetical protein LTT66_18190 [Nocardia gipuzkoensis]|uniref:DUF7459 domain-containing protein n=1 Tax=Nocardia gipuzkoensis TaxID=2749991 RepID=UPI001E47B98C|nr:hypothetical protein [Nocardia gipuzkoensis]UGT65300.1 hypothetical protein LTT66_18190 [Nocardia gipuzkoensis]